MAADNQKAATDGDPQRSFIESGHDESEHTRRNYAARRQAERRVVDLVADTHPNEHRECTDAGDRAGDCRHDHYRHEHG